MKRRAFLQRAAAAPAFAALASVLQYRKFLFS
jgi:hypothetical protein